MNKTSKKRIRLILATAITLLASVTCLNGYSEGSKPFINEKMLQTKTKNDALTALSTLFNKTEGAVCILYPYQSSLVNKDSMSMHINAHLKSINYSSDEGHWSFIYVNSDVISVSRFKRSEKLDILAPHEITGRVKAQLPTTFQPTSCLPIKVAKLLKLKLRDRNYVVMGEIR